MAHGEELAADEGVASALVTKGKGVTKQVEAHCRGAGVQQDEDGNVLGILGSDATDGELQQEAAGGCAPLVHTMFSVSMQP